MALRIITGTTLTASSNILLGTADDVFVSVFATVGSTGGYGVMGTGSSHDARIAGTVIAENIGVRLGNANTDSDQFLSVEVGGRVVSNGASAAQLMGGNSTAVINGTLDGEYAGLQLGGDGSPILVYVTGEVFGRQAGIMRMADANAEIELTITGTLMGESFAYLGNALLDETWARDEIRNRGDILGAVSLGYGDDLFDNRGGRIDGGVFGGEGNDTFRPGAWAEDFYGGNGNDTLDFARGPGVRIALTGGGGTGPALGDFYSGFENLVGSNGGDDRLTGDDQDNRLSGNAGDDRLIGRAGDDQITGGTGEDTLTGGTGGDDFVLIGPDQGVDVITDFDAGQGDQLIFLGLSIGVFVQGSLSPSAFRAAPTRNASDPQQRLIFHTGEATLWYDADGNGSATAPVLIARLQQGAQLSAGDIEVL